MTNPYHIRDGKEQELPKMHWELSEAVGVIQTATLVFPDGYWPIDVDHEKYRLRAPVPFPDSFPAGEVTLNRFSTFIGLLAGDGAEVAIELEAMAKKDSVSGPRLYLRSFHRHEAQDFESWDHQGLYANDVAGLVVIMEAQAMWEDPICFHGGVVLTLLR